MGRVLPLFAARLTMGIVLCSPGWAATVTIGATKDASIFKNNVDNSNGAGPGMFAGTNGMDSPRRGLIEFDIAGNVPTGATITSVQLTLHLGQVAGTDSTPRTIGLFELMDDWGEGTTGSGSTIGGTGQGFPANPGDATWNARFFGATLWTTQGGDHATTASATQSITSVIDAAYIWSSTPALVSNVQGWLNAPSSNFGWELINLDETTATDFRAFFTREVTDPTLRPELDVTFTPAAVPEPESLILVQIGVIGLVLSKTIKRARFASSRDTRNC
jgi:hypothetical protein